MSILLAAYGALSAGSPSLDAASLTAWSGIALTHPTISGTNEDRAITWSVGGARNISASFSSVGTVSYRIDSGGYTTYSGAFSLTSGQTLGWRYQNGIGDESETVTVTDASRGSVLGSFIVSKTGSP